MAAGFGAMALLAVLRLAAVGRPRQVAAAVGLVVAIIVVMTLLQPVWRQLGNANLVVFFVVVVAGAVFAGVPIAFAFGLATLGYVMLTTHYAGADRRRPHGRRRQPPDPAVGAAVRLPRPADRDDGHGACDGGLPRQPARPRARRPALRAGRRDVPRLRHLRLEGGRHGGRRAGAVPGDEEARREGRRPRRAAVGDRRADRDHPAVHRADHDRLGHRACRSPRCSPAACCRPGAGRDAGGGGVGTLPA
jgi:hypothetical protein